LTIPERVPRASDVECRPRWARAESAEKLSARPLPVREPVVAIPTPRGDHRQNEAAARANQISIGAGIALGDHFRDMSEIEFDRPSATRLEVDEERPALRLEQVARVRLSMEQLLAGTTLADLTSLAS
jgi:hypothetical protein